MHHILPLNMSMKCVSLKRSCKQCILYFANNLMQYQQCGIFRVSSIIETVLIFQAVSGFSTAGSISTVKFLMLVYLLNSILDNISVQNQLEPKDLLLVPKLTGTKTA